jgi:CopA family copper-resistance protein
MSLRTLPDMTTNFVGRRRFVQGAAAAGALASFGLPRARAAAAQPWPAGHPELSGSVFNLEIGSTPVNVTGNRASATLVNELLPGPVLRWREGDTVVLNVTNRLSVPTSIHWHGILSPSNMDGVPGLSFAGIMPGETFAYRIPLPQHGTYWYHSHSAFQEQTGLYGAIIVEPKGGYAQRFDRDYVVLLSDWSNQDPEQLVSNLKFQSNYYNWHQRTVGTFFADVTKKGLGATVADRIAWGRMRMDPTDLADVSGITYTYLLNGTAPAANWTGLFQPGERVRLRFINGSSMTFFDVRIPGLKMTVVAADGNDVDPVPVDEFRIGVAETYDVIVEPGNGAYTIFAQSEDRTGFARGTLAPRAGMAGPIPPMDPRPLRTMADMGMGNMAGMNMGGGSGKGSMAGMDMGGNAKGSGSMPGMDMSGGSGGMASMDHGSMPGMAMGGSGKMAGMAMGAGSGGMAGMDMGQGGMAGMAREGSPANPVSTPVVTKPTMGRLGSNGQHGRPGLTGDSGDALGAKLNGSVEVDNVAMAPENRLDDPGIGLGNNGRTVLAYTDLRSLRPMADRRPPSREITLRLTGNMERYIWGFDGKKFSEAGPIVLSRGERVRFTLINDTMMEHPIHLHGMFQQLENGQGDHLPMKHTVIVKPGGKLSYLFTAEPGRWAFHCHLLYHMEMGMFREVRVA